MSRSVPALCFLLAAAPAYSQDPFELLRLGGERIAESRCEEASDLLLRAAKAFESGPPVDPRQLATVWQTLGSAYHCRRLYSKAIQSYRKALELGGTRQKSEILLSLSAAYRNIGRYRDAEDALRQAQQLMEGAPGASPESVAFLLNNRSALEFRLGRTTEAESLLRRAHSILENAPAADPELLVDVLANLAALRGGSGDHREAAVLCSSAVAISSRAVIPVRRLAAIAESCARELRRAGDRRASDGMKARAKALRAASPAEPAANALVDVGDLGRRK